MAEENTAKKLDDEDADSGSADSAADSDQDAAEQVVDSESDAAGDDDQPGGGEATDSQDDQISVDSANEPTIGDEIPVMESPVVSSGPSDQPIADISMILDIPVTLSMEIGQTRISISELLKLGKDSVIELQRMADEPMDVLVNGTLVAHGEAVVVGERFGIRLTDVISPQERLRKFT